MEDFNQNQNKKEIAYTLVGETKDGIILAKLIWKTRGSETSVMFDGAKVLSHEESSGDIVGFFHTHPEGFTNPSRRDDDTMLSWSFCFGKPLLCAIGTSLGVRAWLYDAATAQAPAACAAIRREVKNVQLFKNKRLVAVLHEAEPETQSAATAASAILEAP